MIPASRVTVVSNDGGRVEAHVAKARGEGFDIVDFYSAGDRACTCFAHMVLEKQCEHIAVVAYVVARAVHP